MCCFSLLLIRNTTKCKQGDKGSEDVNIGKFRLNIQIELFYHRCMYELGIKPYDTRDVLGSYRFMSMSPEFAISSKTRDAKFWFWRYIWYPMKEVQLRNNTKFLRAWTVAATSLSPFTMLTLNKCMFSSSSFIDWDRLAYNRTMAWMTGPLDWLEI